MDARKRQALRLKSAQYEMIDGVLFRQNYDKVLLIFLEKDDAKHILTELHDGTADNHFSRETTTHKVLREGYYCHTLFRDPHVQAQKCQICQVNAGRERSPTFPLQLVIV